MIKIQKRVVKAIVKNKFIQSWISDLNNLSKNPSLRTYCMFKRDFSQSIHLSHIKKPKHLIAFSRLRAGSHTLEVERGRYNNPREPIDQRICTHCYEIEDEQHFMMKCKLYRSDECRLFEKIRLLHPVFSELGDRDKFIYLMSNRDEQSLSWTAKFIHDAMYKRATLHLGKS